MTNNKKLLLLLGIVFIFNISAFSQIKINEILASNASINTDADYNSYSDWVELYNETDADINLQGYFITDNYDEPTKWPISGQAVLPAKGYLLVWCDGNATGLHTNFKLSADGEEVALYSPTMQLLDSTSYAPQFVDVSYGRSPDGNKTFSFFMQPTPGASNDTEANSGCANQPEIMTLGGFYNGPVTVPITQDLGGVVRYTLDGSIPTATSQEYTAPIEISQTTTLRARIFQDGLIPGKIITETYFINEDFSKHNLPVVAISTDDANFWDSSRGIYVQNFKPEWEIPVNIELFENNGSDRAAFNELAGIKVNGLYSWILPQKMLGVYFKKQYGESKLSYKLFHDGKRSTFDNFALRASGNDWSNTLFRDGLVQQACRKSGNMNLDLMAFRPSIVYVNGKFLGIHNIRDKVDEDYISSYYGIDKDSFDMIEAGGSNVENGSIDAWNELNTITSKDLSQQANFDELANCFDVENFTDYIATELYCRNTSTDHNTMSWKPKGTGKWRWVLMDTDRGFFNYSNDLLSYYMDVTEWPLKAMMKNSTYKAYLCKRIADQLFTSFNPITINKQIDEHRKDIEPMMSEQIARWLGTTSSYGDAMPSMNYWYDEVEKLHTFADARPTVVLLDLMSYGSKTPAMLSLSATTENACTWLFNGMKTTQSTWFGQYPTELPITLTAESKPGQNFLGWRENTIKEIIPKASDWTYLDNGTDQGTAWTAEDFDAGTWKSGKAPLGYSLSIINTTVSYGSSSSSKYITTYFRKNFTLNEPIDNLLSMKMNLLREDGAVVYLNGKKIISSNMPASELNYKTTAMFALGSPGETEYVTYNIDPSYFKEGENTFAVEIHQGKASSSDLGFDMQLLAEIKGDANSPVSTSPTLEFSLLSDRSLTALYEPTGESVIPDSINTDMTLYKAHSPYIVASDVYIAKNVTLTIEPGVEVRMAPKTNFIVAGSIQAVGTPTDSIMFRLNPKFDASNSWGALCFINSTGTNNMSYMELRDASQGLPEYNCVAAISAFKANLVLSHLRIADVDSNPIAARYSDVKVTDSYIHSNVLGDLINMKYGKAHVENVEFEGNDFPDTDGIDYDGITDGVIKKVNIHHLIGDNSDAIDIGERANGVKIDSVTVYNITDKGVSVGQRSRISLSNSTFINTNLGIGVKDSSRVTVNNCTFFSVATPIANYEKVFGRAGGNVFVDHSIMSNSYDQTVMSDEKSFTSVTNSISDNDPLEEEKGNILTDPKFVSPAYFDLSLKNPYTPKIGSNYMSFTPDPSMEITEIYYDNSTNTDRTEYLCLYNPGEKTLDISNYSLAKGVQFTFPEGSEVAPHGYVYVAKDKSMLPVQTSATTTVYEWTDGSLANEGEAVRLCDKDGICVDQVVYGITTPWPATVVNGQSMVLTLTDLSADNHMAAYWGVKAYPSSTGIGSLRADKVCNITFDDATATATVHLPAGTSMPMDVFTMNGQTIYSTSVTDGQKVDLSGLDTRFIIVRVGDATKKITLPVK